MAIKLVDELGLEGYAAYSSLPEDKQLEFKKRLANQRGVALYAIDDSPSYEESSWIARRAKNLAGGFKKAGLGILGSIYGLGSVAKGDAADREAEEIKQEIRQEDEKLRRTALESIASGDGYLTDVTDAALRLGPGLAAAFLTKQPSLALGTSVVDFSGNIAADNLAKGMQAEEAVADAVARGAIMARIEQLGGGVFGKNSLANALAGGKSSGKRSGVLGEAWKGGRDEAVEEVLAGFADNAFLALTGREDETQSIRDILYSGGVAAPLGAAASSAALMIERKKAAREALDKLKRESSKKKAEEAIDEWAEKPVGAGAVNQEAEAVDRQPSGVVGELVEGRGGDLAAVNQDVEAREPITGEVVLPVLAGEATTPRNALGLPAPEGEVNNDVPELPPPDTVVEAEPAPVEDTGPVDVIDPPALEAPAEEPVTDVPEQLGLQFDDSPVQEQPVDDEPLTGPYYENIAKIDTDSLSDRTVKELKAVAAGVGVSKQGRKAEIIDRIKQRVEEVKARMPKEESQAAEQPSSADAAEIDIDAIPSLTVKELKAVAAGLGLKKGGRKDDLVARITEHVKQKKAEREAASSQPPEAEAVADQNVVPSEAPVVEEVGAPDATPQPAADQQVVQDEVNNQQEAPADVEVDQEASKAPESTQEGPEQAQAIPDQGVKGDRPVESDTEASAAVEANETLSKLLYFIARGSADANKFKRLHGMVIDYVNNLKGKRGRVTISSLAGIDFNTLRKIASTYGIKTGKMTKPEIVLALAVKASKARTVNVNSLDKMPYSELKKIAGEFGVKQNLKRTVMVDEIKGKIKNLSSKWDKKKSNQDPDVVAALDSLQAEFDASIKKAEKEQQEKSEREAKVAEAIDSVSKVIEMEPSSEQKATKETSSVLARIFDSVSSVTPDLIQKYLFSAHFFGPGSAGDGYLAADNKRKGLIRPIQNMFRAITSIRKTLEKDVTLRDSLNTLILNVLDKKKVADFKKEGESAAGPFSKAQERYLRYKEKLLKSKATTDDQKAAIQTIVSMLLALNYRSEVYLAYMKQFNPNRSSFIIKRMERLAKKGERYLTRIYRIDIDPDFKIDEKLLNSVVKDIVDRNMDRWVKEWESEYADTEGAPDLKEVIEEKISELKAELRGKLKNRQESVSRPTSILRRLGNMSEVHATINAAWADFVERNSLDNVPTTLDEKTLNKIVSTIYGYDESFIPPSGDRVFKKAVVEFFDSFYAKNSPQEKSEIVSMLNDAIEWPENVRRLWGEVTDPLVRLEATLSKVSVLYSNVVFEAQLIKAYNKGRANGSKVAFVERPEGEYNRRVGDIEGLEGFKLLGNMYTNDQGVKALRTIVEEYRGWRPGLFSKINAALKKMFTVYNVPKGLVMNAVSGLLQLAANGIIPTKAELIKFGKALYSYKETGIFDREALNPFEREIVRSAAAHSLLDGGLIHQEIAEGLGDNVELSLVKEAAGVVQKAARETDRTVSLLFTAPDELAKLLYYRHALMRKAKQKGMPLNKETVRKLAGEVSVETNKVMLNFSDMPLVIRMLGRSLAIGTFVSFPYKFIANTAATYKLGLQEIAKGDMYGARRIGFMTAIMSLMWAVMYADNDEDEDELVGDFFRGAGRIECDGDTYITDSINPFSVFMTPLNLAMRGDYSKAATSLLGAYISPGLGVQLVNTLFAGIDNFGNKVDSEGDDGFEIASKRIAAASSFVFSSNVLVKFGKGMYQWATDDVKAGDSLAKAGASAFGLNYSPVNRQVIRGSIFNAATQFSQGSKNIILAMKDRSVSPEDFVEVMEREIERKMDAQKRIYRIANTLGKKYGWDREDIIDLMVAATNQGYKNLIIGSVNGNIMIRPVDSRAAYNDVVRGVDGKQYSDDDLDLFLQKEEIMRLMVERLYNE